MTTPLPKLVRDRIPELIEADGRSAITQTLPADELPLALLAKLREETAELAAARGEDMAEELADVFEVVRSLSAVLGIDWLSVLAAAERKAEERGTFSRGLMLVDVHPSD
jgi:predicted house-cleaning noncanonical NTP pyrophosphatase (MazG superfamily)